MSLFKSLFSFLYTKLVKVLPLSFRVKNELPISIKEKSKLIATSIKNVSRSSKKDSVKLLIWGAGGMGLMAQLESVISTALRMRGADVSVVVCDGVLSGCVLREVKEGEPIYQWKRRCKSCYSAMRDFYESFDLKVVRQSKYISDKEQNNIRSMVASISDYDIKKYVYSGVNVGIYTYSSATRYFKDVNLNDCSDILREYLYSAIVSTEISIRVIEDYRPNRVLMSHGIYVDWGPMLDISTQNGIPVLQWGSGYRADHIFMRMVTDGNDRNRMVLSKNDWLLRANNKLTREEENILDRYLEIRYKVGYFDNTRFGKLPEIQESKFSVSKLLSISGEKPVWCIFCHVNWDAVFVDSKMQFNGVNEWIDYTIDIISNNKAVDWLIKIHPNESGWDTGKGVYDHISNKYNNLPSNIKVLTSDVKINNYDFYPILDGCITLHGTAGLELALMGKPVIIAANAHYGGKGFTYDALEKSEYKDLLSRAQKLGRMSDEKISLARRYAYSIFIQRQLSLESVLTSNKKKLWEFDYKNIGSLALGCDSTIDMISDKIIKGESLILE